MISWKRRIRKSELVGLASAFLKIAPSMKDVLAAHRFPENFVEGIGTKINELTRAQDDYRNARRKYSASVTSARTLIREALAALKRFDVVVAITKTARATVRQAKKPPLLPQPQTLPLHECVT
jgi:DNA-binding FadR family transcriptional regulator